MQLVLASTSRYRRILLERLGLPFSVADPRIDENRRPGEAPEAMASRLAEAKAQAVAPRFPDSLVIGCDQVAISNGEVLGKPGNHDNAVRQLRALSAGEAVFHTAVCVHNSSDGTTRVRVVPCRVSFRNLDDGVIDRYLAREQAYDCAGSARAEGLGIALIAKMEGEDPTALIGLPLIALVDLLREQGLNVI
ncbi:MAG: nucleoside triphosphate pyrophosphatase [Burkholderiales bacterium]